MGLHQNVEAMERHRKKRERIGNEENEGLQGNRWTAWEKKLIKMIPKKMGSLGFPKGQKENLKRN